LNVYEAISKVGEPYKVEEWSFVNIISQKRDPVSADITIRKSLGDSLKGFIIF
jgi:hypothetical protein